MKILFVCTGNSCRSPMAEGYLRKRLEDAGRPDIEVSSAGTLPASGMAATREAIAVTAEAGVDISGHRSRMLTRADVDDADLILVMQQFHRDDVLSMAPEAEDKVYLLNAFGSAAGRDPAEEPDIPDPIGKPVEFYRETFKAIKSAIDNMVPQIIK